MRAPRSAGESDKSWNPTEEELCKGIEYINDYAPLSNSKNEHYLWVLLQIRDADSPLNGWPQHIVLKACANRFTGNSQAEPEYIYIYFFPLLVRLKLSLSQGDGATGHAKDAFFWTRAPWAC